MSARLAQLLSVALIGACLATPASARSSHHHARPAVAAKGPTLIWRGDVTTARGVVDDMANAWARSGHGRIELQPFNTASGLDAVRGGTADLAGSARDSDGSAADSRLQFTPVAWDALVMITHPSNPVSSLTLKQVHDIYYGKITNWSQVGGRNEPIDVYAVASPGDGVEYSLRRLLFGRGNQPVAAPRLYVNTAKLEEGIALDTKGLGATTMAGVAGNRKVKMIRIDGTAPTVANVADGSYALYTPLYLVTNPNSPKVAEENAFIAFLGTEPAKAVMRRHGVLPYQDASALASMDEARRARILAEVGARAVPSAPRIAAPGATYAARAAEEPTSQRTVAARRALAERKSESQAKAVVAAAQEKASLAGVQGSATTVGAPASHGHDFTKVRSDAAVHRAGTYTVGKGDTLGSIARKHAVKLEQLRDWNHLKGNTVRLGQVLRVSPN
jgi:phosphate transport system substrate-binding protein